MKFLDAIKNMCNRMGLHKFTVKAPVAIQGKHPVAGLPTASDLDTWAEEQEIREKTSHEVKPDGS